MSRTLNFDKLARPYRWLEYATFGRALERCRFHFLPQLKDARRALVFGDGDGRFLAQLLKANPQLHADVVDISPAMLRLLKARLTPEARGRITMHPADAREFAPPKADYDLVVTHFFFDCLFQAELDKLFDRVAPRLRPGAFWVVSEFSQMQGSFSIWVGKAVVSSLYSAFGVLTGLRVRSLPDHHVAFKSHGFRLAEEKQWLRGLLVSQLWQP